MKKGLLLVVVVISSFMIYHNINRCPDDIKVINEMAEVCSQYLQENPDGICD